MYTSTWNAIGTLSSSGRTYIGEFIDGSFNGQGTMRLNDVKVYVGQWKNNSPNGEGTETYINGDKYTGGFRDGKYDGSGMFIMNSGAKYAGEFKGGKYDGNGIVTYADGGKWVGEFHEGKYNGQGIEYNASGAVVRSGGWENGNFINETAVAPAGSSTKRDDTTLKTAQPSSRKRVLSTLQNMTKATLFPRRTYPRGTCVYVMQLHTKSGAKDLPFESASVFSLSFLTDNASVRTLPLSPPANNTD